MTLLNSSAPRRSVSENLISNLAPRTLPTVRRWTDLRPKYICTALEMGWDSMRGWNPYSNTAPARELQAQNGETFHGDAARVKLVIFRGVTVRCNVQAGVVAITHGYTARPKSPTLVPQVPTDSLHSVCVGVHW
jgi:hypothetical protein